MDNLRDALIDSFKTGTFLQTVYACSLAQRDERDALAAELATLHNEGKIDVIKGFATLSKKPEAGVDFFLTRRVFENALPQIAAPVQPVMACIHQLYTEAGRDGAAGIIFNAYIAFCEKDPSRPKEALKEIADNPEFLNLLAPTIIAGSRIDTPHYLAEALRLAAHNSVEVRRKAIFALGRIQWPEGATPPEAACAALETAVANEHDDELLGCAINTAFSLLQPDKTKEDRVANLIENALSKGGDYALHAASELFGFHTGELSEDIIDGLVPQLLGVKPANKASTDNIDHGIAHLLRTDKATKAIDFLQDFLIAHADEISLKSFDSVVRQVRQHEELMNKVSTRWLLRGERILCEGVKTIVGSAHGANPLLEIDPAELKPADAQHIIFVARKAIGYLFFSPISAVSLIISLMHTVPDEQSLFELANLLFDPLLLNYTGKAREYVAQRAATECAPVKEELNNALKAVDNYLERLKSVGDIPELHPSEAQREGYNRRFARQMAESMKEAEAKSAFLSLVSKQVLLYGRGSINYVYGPDGQASRQEIPLQGHSVEIEFPRQERLDPYGLEYMLRVFQAEQLRT